MWKNRLSGALENLFDFLEETARRLRYNLNWRLVRGLGQLQILTRASYILLVLVPLLVTLWPAVRVVVNQYNQAVGEATRLLHIAVTDLDRAVEKARLKAVELVDKSGGSPPSAATDRVNQLLDELGRLTTRVAEVGERYANDYTERVIKTPMLPWSLGAAFFSALLVVLGHLVYQLRAPEVVRLFTWDGFVSSRMEDFSKYPTDDALDRSRQYLGTRLAQRLGKSDQYEFENILVRLYGNNQDEREQQLRELPLSQLRSLIQWLESGDLSPPKDYQREILDLARKVVGAGPSDATQNMTIVERGARAEYLRLADQNPFSIVLTTCLYGLAIWLIMLIIKVQASAVFVAAGWQSLGDLLFH
jgi:hypothetical protein